MFSRASSVKTVLVGLLLTGAVMAGSFRIDAVLSDSWPKYCFEFAMVDSATRLWFDVPEHCRYIITIEQSGGVSDRRTLAATGLVDVVGPGSVRVTVQRDSGVGRWSCRHFGAGELVLQSVTGFAGPGSPCRFSFVSAGDVEVWQFAYPTEATFHVLRLDGGQVVEQQDLYDDTKLKLFGPGLQTLEISPSEGDGAFSARRAE